MAAYGDLVGWRAYAAARGNTAPAAATDADADAALTRAGDFIAFHYVANFVAPAPDDVVLAAAYEAAALELATPSLFRRTYTPGEAKVLTGVKGINWQVVGDASKDGAMMPTSTIIEAMLGRYTGRNVGLGMRSVG